MRWLVALFVFSVLRAATLDATTIHVSMRGDDTAEGSRAAPLRTISAAAKLAIPGDTVLVGEGVYRERVAPPRAGEPGKPITYRAEPGKRVFVKGSELWTPEWRRETHQGVYSAVPSDSLFNDRNEEYVDHYNPFKVQLSSTPWGREGRREEERRQAGDKRIGRADSKIVYTCGQVFLNGRRLREVPLREELKPRHWWYDELSDRIWIHFGKLAPTKQEVEITTRRRIFAPTRRGLGHIVVEGFIFEHCGNQYPTNFWENDANAQKGAVGTEAGHHWTIRNNVVRHAKTFAIDVGSVDRHSKSLQVKGNRVERNYIVDNGSAGILSNSSVALVIRGNLILRNNQLRFIGIKRWEQAGVKCHGFRDGLIEANYIADNHDTYGIWLDNQFPDSRVSRNFIYRNGRAGIFLEMSDYDFDRLLVDNNIVLENKENAVYIHDASGATFLHNLLGNTQDTKGYGQAVHIRQSTVRTRSYHHSFFGNLLIGNARNVDVNYPAYRSGIQQFDFNAYVIEPGSHAFAINPRSDVPSPWTSVEFARLVRKDLAASHDSSIEFEQGNALLSLEQWRDFWHLHGVENDRDSQIWPSAKVSYDAMEHVLRMEIDQAPKSSGSLTYEGVESDYLGNRISDAGTALPGPLQNLTEGVNNWVIWQGLPVLPHGQLPAQEWTLQ